jgi:hypothetical protein
MGNRKQYVALCTLKGLPDVQSSWSAAIETGRYKYDESAKRSSHSLKVEGIKSSKSNDDLPRG